MKSIVIWFAKKYALSAVKDAVTAKSQEVSKWSVRICGWIEKIEKVLSFLKDLSSRLSDGDLYDEEANAVMDESIALAAEITK